MQFLSENRLYKCQIFGWFRFFISEYPNPNRIFCTPLMFSALDMNELCVKLEATKLKHTEEFGGLVSATTKVKKENKRTKVRHQNLLLLLSQTNKHL